MVPAGKVATSALGFSSVLEEPEAVVPDAAEGLVADVAPGTGVFGAGWAEPGAGVLAALPPEALVSGGVDGCREQPVISAREAMTQKIRFMREKYQKRQFTAMGTSAGMRTRVPHATTALRTRNRMRDRAIES
jgi:hypothetical protein